MQCNVSQRMKCLHALFELSMSNIHKYSIEMLFAQTKESTQQPNSHNNQFAANDLQYLNSVTGRIECEIRAHTHTLTYASSDRWKISNVSADEKHT